MRDRGKSEAPATRGRGSEVVGRSHAMPAAPCPAMPRQATPRHAEPCHAAMETHQLLDSSVPLTPAACRAWEAAAPLNDPAYWLGRSHGYQSGYYDALEDLDNWRRGNSLLKPSVFIELTAEQVHRVGGGGRG